MRPQQQGFHSFSHSLSSSSRSSSASPTSSTTTFGLDSKIPPFPCYKYENAAPDFFHLILPLLWFFPTQVCVALISKPPQNFTLKKLYTNWPFKSLFSLLKFASLPRNKLAFCHRATAAHRKGESGVAGIAFAMGEAPAFFVDELQKGFANGFDVKSKGGETSVVVGNRTYVIGGACEESALSIGVCILDQSSGEWINPVVLGTKPKPSKGHSAVLLSEDRILITKNGSSTDDFAWFLEVDTQYVRQQKKILGTEVVAWSKGVRGYAEKPIVISGPSGVGKGTLISMLMKEYPSMFGFSVSHTTRAPRAMEKDGVHYHFIERSVMEKELVDGKFLEFASVHGNLYGTSVEAVEVVADAGKRCILDIDVQGARSVRASSLEAIFIFVCPPSMEELEKRLRARGTETEEQVLKRLRNAKAEIEQGQSSGIFDHMLYNDNLEDCYQSLKKLLGLDGTVTAAPKSASKVIDLPMDHSLTKIDNKIIINSRTPELEKASTNTIVLDVSALEGGAPGRTRGLDIYTMDSFSDGLTGINQ